MTSSKPPSRRPGSRGKKPSPDPDPEPRAPAEIDRQSDGAAGRAPAPGAVRYEAPRGMGPEPVEVEGYDPSVPRE